MSRSTRSTRSRLMVAAAGIASVALVALGAGTAFAAPALNGSHPGDLELLSGGTVVTSGPLTMVPTWATIANGCPAGTNDAKLAETTPLGSGGDVPVAAISGAIDQPPTGPFPGTLVNNNNGTGNSVGALLALAGVTPAVVGGASSEWVVACEGLAGGTVYGSSIVLTVAYNGTTFTVTSGAPTGGGGNPGGGSPNNDPDSVFANLTVDSTVALTMNETAFSLAGLSGTTAASAPNAVSYSFTTNDTAGAIVTVQAASDFESLAPVAGHLIPASDASATTLVNGVAGPGYALPENPAVVTAASNTGPGTESVQETWSVAIPANAVQAGYQTSLTYTLLPS